MELIDKIIELESNPNPPDSPTTMPSSSSGFGFPQLTPRPPFFSSLAAAPMGFPLVPAARQVAGARRPNARKGSAKKHTVKRLNTQKAKSTTKKTVKWQKSPTAKKSTASTSSKSPQAASSRKRPAPSDSPTSDTKKPKKAPTRASVKSTTKKAAKSVAKPKPKAAPKKSKLAATNVQARKAKSHSNVGAQKTKQVVTRRCSSRVRQHRT